MERKRKIIENEFLENSVNENDKKKTSRKKKTLIFVSILLSVIIILLGSGLLYVKFLLGKAPRVELDTDNLGITDQYDENYSLSEENNGNPVSETTESFSQVLSDYENIVTDFPEDVINIALFGVDSRDMNETSGRSDATMILSFDKIHNKVKITSIARDSYVSVEGHGKTKLTHAYAYGGHQLAVKTLNQNFGLNIQDFVSVNFSQLATIIDFIGGVKINVTEEERQVMEGYIRELNNIGVATEQLTQTGDVVLSGGQAVAYARNRYTGTDVDRMNRQYEVLVAMVESVKNMGVSKYSELISLILSQCVTSLSDSEMISLGIWAMTTIPEFSRFVLPNNECEPSGQIIDGLWYYVYNLPKARSLLHKFIYEQ